jgi:uncharacterized membrane protein
MKEVVSILLWIHVLSGFTAFFVAPCALATKKGGKAHRRWGKIFFWAMLAGTTSASIIALYRPIPFLFLISIFAFYLTFTGYRVLRRKTGKDRPKVIDWIVSIAMLITGAGLIGLGIFSPPGPGFRIISLVFGSMSILFSAQEIRGFSSFQRTPSTGFTNTWVTWWELTSRRSRPSRWSI